YGGLTTLQLLILQTLAVENELTASQLARCVSLSAATLSGVLERLAGRGLVSRSRDEQDRRRHWMRLEPAGRAVLAEAPSLLPRHVMERYAALEVWLRHALMAGLLRAVDLFEEPEEDE